MDEFTSLILFIVDEFLNYILLVLQVDQLQSLWTLISSPILLNAYFEEMIDSILFFHSVAPLESLKLSLIQLEGMEKSQIDLEMG